MIANLIRILKRTRTAGFKLDAREQALSGLRKIEVADRGELSVLARREQAVRGAFRLSACDGYEGSISRMAIPELRTTRMDELTK